MVVEIVYLLTERDHLALKNDDAIDKAKVSH